MRHVVLARFWRPPLLRDQSPPLGVLNTVAPPLVWGLLCGVLSEVGYGAFVVGVVLSFVGAFAAGRQHDGASSGLARGLVAGSLFGSAVLLGHDLSGDGALPLESPLLQVLSTAAIASLLGALGGITRHHELCRVAETPPADAEGALTAET